MRSFVQIAGWVMGLIAIYLFVSNGTQTTQVINALSSPALTAIKELQGRG